MKISYLICLFSLSIAPSISLAEDIFAANETVPGQFYAGFSLLKSEAECDYQGLEANVYSLGTTLSTL